MTAIKPGPRSRLVAAHVTRYRPEFAVPVWLVLLAVIGMAVLPAAIIYASGEWTLGFLLVVAAGSCILRYIGVLAFCGLADVIVSTRDDHRLDLLMASLFGHAFVGFRDVGVALAIVGTNDVSLSRFSIELFDPISILGVYLSASFLKGVSWTWDRALLAATIAWSGDLVGKILLVSIF